MHEYIGGHDDDGDDLLSGAGAVRVCPYRWHAFGIPTWTLLSNRNYAQFCIWIAVLHCTADCTEVYHTHHTHCIITALLLLLHYRQLLHHDEIPKSNAPMYVHRSKESLHSIRNGGRVVFGGFGLCGTGTPLSLAVCRNRANPWDAIHGSARVFQRK